MALNEKQKFNNRWNRLDNDYREFGNLYRELSMYVLAHRGRFLGENRKIKRNTKQINNKARRACRTLQGGLMAGITSPARPWFKLQTPDPDMNDFRPVKLWLRDVERIMREIFNQSNIYNSFHQQYGELGCFGIAPMGIYQDFDNVIHTQVYTIGGYRVASDEKGHINVFYRQYELSVDQMVKKWGQDKVSTTVRNMFKQGETEVKRKVMHVIEPNDGRDSMSPASWNKPVRSVYIELDCDELGYGIYKTGFNENPIVCPRWEVIGEETYATGCPAMDCLGDVKSLQLGERRSFQATDKMVDPPLQGPATFSSYRSAGGVLPGEILIGDDPSGKGLRSIYDVNFNIKEHEEKLRQIERRIDETFYVDLFMMLANDNRSNITAREVVERHEEKLLMLGPVLERLHNELLDPVIDRTFNIMQEVGILPTPPEEIAKEGATITVNYISVLAQAQKMTITSSLDQFLGYASAVAQVFPRARHKVNEFQLIDAYAEALTMDPELIRSTDEAEEMAAQEANAASMAAAMEQAPGMASAAKSVSEIDPDRIGDTSQLRQLTGL